MELKYDYWTGHFEDVKGSLIRNISQYSINNNAIKIGITTNPEKRKKEYQNSNLGWKKMIIKYQTDSEKYINVMDDILSNYHWDFANNEETLSESENPYYLYLLIK